VKDIDKGNGMIGGRRECIMGMMVVSHQQKMIENTIPLKENRYSPLKSG
jgi:hypothetical protein